MIFSVSDFLDQINDLLSSERVAVTGEVSEWKVYPSGIYFSIKDKADGSVLRCYMHPSVFRGAGVVVEVGMEVKLSGSPAIYKPTGQFNFRATSIELVGEGALKKAYELLMKKLQEEGLFARKRPLPERIERIGIVSSRGGVVIQDFRKNLAPLNFRLFFRDSRVEGAQAVPELVRAIRAFNRTMPDLDALVIIRGGGSLESMQAFNNELVCREIFSSKIPVVAGIGHDVDVPIAALVADAMVSTPTAAAHLMNQSWDGFRAAIEESERAIIGCFDEALADQTRRVDRATGVMFSGLRHIFVLFADLEKRFLRGALGVEKRIEGIAKMIDGMLLGAMRQMERALSNARAQADTVLNRSFDRIEYSLRATALEVEKAEKLLLFSDPRRNLRLGYSIVFDMKGRVIKRSKDLKIGDTITSSFAEGEALSTITEIN